MLRRATRPLIFLLIVLAPSAGAHEAHKRATGVVAERSDLMKAVSRDTKRIGQMLEGRIPYDAETFRSAATAIQQAGGARFTALFPEGSAGPTSEALPAIWQDWPRFTAYADQLAALGTVLAETADRGPSSNGEQKGVALGLGAAPSPLLSAEEIQALAEGGPKAAFDKLVKTCQACHSDFRKPQ